MAEAGRQGRGRRPASGEPVVDRALRMLAAFDSTHRRLTLSEMARRSSIPLSSAHRLAERLADWGAIEREDDGRYVIGLRLYEVASLAPRGHGLREVASPYLEDLFVVTRHHVQLAVLEGSEAVMVERRSGPGAVKVEYRVGGKLPLLTTALGQVLVANLSPARRDEVLAGCTRPDDLALMHDRAKVDAVLDRVRTSGFSVVTRREPAPLVAVAAPIRGRGDEAAAALSLVVPAGTPTQSLEPVLRTAARSIARSLRDA
ncbi:MAG: IclR family transcriptional regulator [Acidimicrobiales bacterium]